MEIPQIGSYRLRILSPTILELTLINTKNSDPGSYTAWNFVSSTLSLAVPSASEFAVTADGQAISVRSVGFKRIPIYAPQMKRDLRIGNYLYLELASSIADQQAVEVKNPNGRLWSAPVKYVSTADPLRFNPAIHVNQIGYMPEYPKKVMIGYYLGSLGETAIPFQNGFRVIDANTGAVVHQGSLTVRADRGFSYTSTPYQKVYQADFSAFKTPGEYKIMVPGMGVSLPFRIDEGTAAAFTRTFALGLFHQRCGIGNEFPYTRHTHDQCHAQPADVPTMDATFAKVQSVLADVTSDYANEPRHTAPRLENVAASLYPLQRQGKVDVSRGHHDAGDYSKYTINSAGLIHYLVFAADSFPGVGQLDNLGLPESGDGKSDILQEAKWEADFLAKMQDTDGGFYFLVYPKDRRYENDVLPDQGDPQVVWPKTTAVTAAAVAALAEAGSSPLMKQQFPAEAAIYLQKAELGWAFLQNAIAQYGKDGSYQKITHYGHEFIHDDELAWAAAALYAATGEDIYQQKLFEWFPNPTDNRTRRWSWWRLFEGYGSAVRTYAFAARSGRLPASKLNAAYLAKCEAEIVAAGDDQTRWSNENSYGTSFPDLNKQYRSAGWYFSSERAFDVTVAYQLVPKPEYREAVAANFNYEAGCNPVNVSYITGLGLKQPRDVVHQYAQNDDRVLPPSGLPQGNIQDGFGYHYHYKEPGTAANELNSIAYPALFTLSDPYPFYDRWADTYDTERELVVTDQARSVASLAFWMAQSSVSSQPWSSVQGQIVDLPAQAAVGEPLNVRITAPGVDLSNARVTWEVQNLEPVVGHPYVFSPKFPGETWIEAEALLPDGRRVFAATAFNGTTGADTPPNSYQSAPLPVTSDIAALYHADDTTADATGKNPALTLSGNARLDRSNVGWMNQQAGGALRFLDLGDKAIVRIPATSVRNGPATTSIAIEAMIYVNALKGYNRGVANIISMEQNWEAYMRLKEDTYAGLLFEAGRVLSVGGNLLSLGGGLDSTVDDLLSTGDDLLSGGGGLLSSIASAVTQALTSKSWHHLSIGLDQTSYTVKLDGVVLGTAPSTDLLKWGNSGTVTIELGNFDGWIDEVAVRSFRSSTAAPTVTLTAPVAGSVFDSPGTVNLAATATGSSTIQKVEFFAGQTKLGEDRIAPYTYAWPATAGNHTISARATDSLGRVGSSAPVAISVNGVATVAASLKPLGVVPTGGFRLQITGQSGKQYRVQASADHKNWSDLGTVTLTGTTGEFIDTASVGQYRFYRLALVQ